MSNPASSLGVALLALAGGAFCVPALAACKQELAVYAEPDAKSSLEFRPSGAPAASNEFKLVFAENDIVLDGIVMWTDGVARPFGMLMHKCPEGDVTGEELAACTVWQGVVYAVDAAGKVGLLAAEGSDAAAQLVFPDLGPALRQSSVYGMSGITKLPWDAFALAGCQE
ncbi:MAG: hypothetical protein Q8Q62_21295 [Mesorhizobium sp.]|nr:hypothetical protein [Mesorhizobium sp.]